MTTQNSTLTHMLCTLENRLLDPAFHKQRASLEALLAPEFREVGISGMTTDREAAIAEFAEEQATPEVTLEDFSVHPLGTEASLATYSMVADGKRAHGSSIWVYRRGNWRLLYRQTTSEKA